MSKMECVLNYLYNNLIKIQSMNTKTILAGMLLTLLSLPALAQQASETPRRATIEARGDSVVIRKGEGDLRIQVYEEQAGEGEESEAVEIYEGIYLEREDETTNAFLDALPFIPKKKKHNAYEPHNSGLYIGFARMTDRFLKFSDTPRFPEDLSCSWEFGFNFLSTYHNFKKNPHWGLNIGASWGYRSFNISGGVALVKENGQSVFSPGDANTAYSRSRLRHFFFRIPITVEWQQRLSTRGHLVFFNLGPEIEIRHGVKSFTHINGGKKTRVGKGMYVNPVGVSLLAQAGYGDFGFYLRYNTYSFFQKGKGPDVEPLSFGIAWYW